MAADNELAIVLTVVADQLKAGLAAAGEAVGGWATETKAALAEVEAAGAQMGAAMGAWAGETIAAMTEVESAGEGFHGIFAGLAEALGAEKIVGGLKDMAIAAAEAHDPLEVAAQVAHNLGHAFDAAKAETFLEGLATSGKAGTASIQDLRAGMQILAQVTNTQAQADRATAIAAQLAAARHMSFGDAVGVVAKVLTGHVALLGRYGFATKDAAGKTLESAAAMEMLDTATKDASEVVGKGLPAQLAQLRNRFSILSDSIGALLLPALLAIVSVGDKVVDWFRGMSPQALGLIAALGGLAGAFLAALSAATLLGVVMGPLAAGFGALMSPVGAVIAIVVALAAAALYLATHWTQSVAVMRGAWTAIQNAVHAAVTFIIARWNDLGLTLSGLGDLFMSFTSDVRADWAAIVGFVETAVRYIGDRFNDLDRALGGTGDAWADLSRGIASICTAILGAIEGMVNAAVSMLGSLGSAISNIVGKIAGAVGAFGGSISKSLLAHMDPQMAAGLAKITMGLGHFRDGMAGLGKSAGTGLVNGVVAAVHAGEAAIAGAGKFVQDLFKRHALPTSDDDGKPAFDNAQGEGVGKGGKKGAGGGRGGAGKVDTDALKTQLDAIRAGIAAVLDAAADDVDRAQANLEAATAKLETYKASIGGKATTSDEAAHEQALITQEMQAQKAVGAAILAQKAATEAAAAREAAVAKSLGAEAAAQLKTTTASVDAAARLGKAHSAAAEAAAKSASAQVAAYKTLSDQAAQFLTAQGKHTTEAIRLGTAYSRVQGELAKLVAAMKEPLVDLQELNDGIAEAAGKAAQAGAQGALDAGEAGIAGQKDAARFSERTDEARGKERTPVQGDKAELKTADLDLALADLRLQFAQTSAAIATATAQAKVDDAIKTGDAKLIAKANAELALAMQEGAEKIKTATINVASALADVSVASTKLATDTAANTFSLTSALTTMAQKITALIPGLSMGNSGALLFNWQAALGAALEKTQAYAKIQQVVTQLMNLFAQIIDKLMPLIDVLLNIITALANGFVALWNIVAKLLSLIGIQIGDLTDLNNGLVPLISVVHNIPTLNELAAGKTKSPLSQNPVAVNAPVVNALKSPGLGGGIFSKLVELALVLVVIHLVLLHHTISTQTQLQQANTSLTQIAANTQAMAASGGGGGGGLGGLMGMMGPWGMAAAAAVGVIGMLASSGSGSNDSSDNGDNPQNENSGTIVVGDGSGGQNAPGLNQLSGSGAVAAAAAAAAKYIASQQFASALNTSSVIAATAAVAAAASAAMGKAKDSTSRKAAAVLGSLGGAQSAAAGAIDNSKRTNISSTLTMGDVNVRSDADLAALQASLALFTINSDITGRYSLGRVTT